ncbi:MAG: hypothetical protein PF440_09790 [Thiomicrorhabdus sp.]|jgi:hypothetical protein|nr:hypothetical protein [Thiomicrorhabdus sp.]
MNRRNFLALGAKLAASLAIPTSLVGCGGGSGDAADLAPNAATSSIDSSLATTSALQSDADGTTTALNDSLSSTLASPTVAPASSSMASVRTSSDSLTVEDNAKLVEFFQTRTPMYAPVTPVDGTTYLTSHYLENSGTGTLWENAVSAQQLAYEQYTHQYTKLVATMRLFNSKNDSSTDAQTASASSVAPRVVVQASARSLVASPKAIDALDLLDGLIKLISSSFTSTGLGLIADGLQAVYTWLSELLGTSQLQGLAYSFLVTASVDDMLQAVITKNTTGLAFDDRTNIMLSLSKISVASGALLTLTKMNDLENATADSIDTEFMTTYLANNNVVTNISLMWLGLSETMTSDVVGTMQASARDAIELDANRDVMPDTTGLITTLETNSTILAMVSLAIKSIFSVMESETVDTKTTGFTADSSADIFKILFTSEQSPTDVLLSSFMGSALRKGHNSGNRFSNSSKRC